MNPKNVIDRKIPQRNIIGTIFTTIQGSMNNKIVQPIHFSPNVMICLNVLMSNNNIRKTLCLNNLITTFPENIRSENTSITVQMLESHSTKLPEPIFKFHL